MQSISGCRLKSRQRPAILFRHAVGSVGCELARLSELSDGTRAVLQKLKKQRRRKRPDSNPPWRSAFRPCGCASSGCRPARPGRCTCSSCRAYSPKFGHRIRLQAPISTRPAMPPSRLEHRAPRVRVVLRNGPKKKKRSCRTRSGLGSPRPRRQSRGSRRGGCRASGSR